MADVIRKSTNRFTKGLVMDFSPENTKNEVLTHALNATLLTFNGNELSLQNDMGNARVETAYLPEGYIPVGTCEYGGIIYIVSYNPLEDKSQIGCFPSPERNISNEELGIPNKSIERDWFQVFENGFPTGEILHNTQYVLLKNDKLNPGDKFIVTANKEIYNERLSDLYVNQKQNGIFEPISNPILSLNVVSIEDSGKIVYLNNDIRKYEVSNTYEGKTDIYKYHILGKMAEKDGVYNQKVDLDDYRNVLQSGYSVFKSKTSGKLAILAELLMIDSYSVTHELVPRKDENGNNNGFFDIVLHTEVTPEITEENFKVVPKLHYYYLENSQGYLQVKGSGESLNNTVTLFQNGTTGNFESTPLYNIYEPIDTEFAKALNPELGAIPTLGNSGEFNFPKANQYHGKMVSNGENNTGSVTTSTFTKFTEGKFHRLNKSQIDLQNVNYFNNTVRAKFYYYNSGDNKYEEFTGTVINDSYTYYINSPIYTYYDAQRDTQYQDYILYELKSNPIVANEDQINDKNIEKYKEQEIHIYRIATTEDIKNSETLYTTEDGKTYSEFIGEPIDGVTYYVLKIEKNLVSVGTEPEVATGTFWYYPDNKEYAQASKASIADYYDTEKYPYDPNPPYGCPITLYWREAKDNYVPATSEQINNYKNLGITLYYSTEYIMISNLELFIQGTNNNQMFIVVPVDTFVAYDKFIPNYTDNYIEGGTKPSGNYPKDDPISLYTLSDFLPGNLEDTSENYLKYNSIKFASIKIPKLVYENGLDLPFKYDYTIVPCMSYGKLQHLAVSNTIDFSKLHDFNKSDFNVWKYRIDNNQLRLTFGASVYDIYEKARVDALILEFYDCWGFAGSLEIVDKKSYSGIFTKIIPLNSFRAISKKKINGNEQIETYKRNINITEAKDKETGAIIDGQYLFKEKLLTESYPSPSQGWTSLPDMDEKTKEEFNDCGTLYSNILYGVKTYFRRTREDGTKEFIKKRDFFLYTLPIYNDYYYSIDDFSNLINPEIQLMLTYKLKDTSTRSVYTLEGQPLEENKKNEIISNGYTKQDNDNVSSYLGGFYERTDLDLIKYYKYKGTTSLYLEVGLKQEYEDLNISYDPELNSIFNCKLRLISNDEEDKTFTVNSEVDGLIGTNQILNYNSILQEYIIDNKVDLNKLEFKNHDSGTPNIITTGMIRNSNFITLQGEAPININYEFVVGYTINIADIRSTQVQATTVCALFHKKPTGEYNYEDFSIHAHDTGNVKEETGEPIYEYLSSVMFYNTGNSKKELFGICEQLDTTGTMESQLNDITSVETDALNIKIPKKLNTGDPLKQLVSRIGKLTFCQPHVHGYSEEFGVNIYPAADGFGIGPNINVEGDEGNGIVGASYLYENPRYNSCLNTKDMINHAGEFISTIDYKETTGTVLKANLDGTWEVTELNNIPMRAYTGLTGEQLAIFNDKLLKTMSSIYAYNPDYDSLEVKAGNVTIQNYNPKFTSNLLNTESNLAFNDNNGLNKYIYLGPISFQNYLKHLSDFSNSQDGEIIKVEESKEIEKDGEIITTIKPLPQVQLTPNYDYCGTKDNYYLISSLTYNTPVPKEIEQELEFSSSNITVVKHTNGDNTFMQGSPNKKTLYGYHPDYGKMIQLDVSNYTIDTDGTLNLKKEQEQKIESKVTLTSEMIKSIYSGSYSFDHKFKITNENKEEEITLNLLLSLDKYGVAPLKCGETSFFMGTEYSSNVQGCTFSMTPNLQITNSVMKTNYTYSVKINSIKLKVKAIALNDKVSLYGYPIPLNKQDISSLQTLTSGSNTSITLIDSYNQPISSYNTSYYWAGDQWSGISANGIECGDFSRTIPLDDQREIKFQFIPNLNPNGSYVLSLFEFVIEEINFTITQISQLKALTETFVTTTRTNKYSNIIQSKYTVDQDYKNAQFKGSSFTINDLIYDPTPDGHRLFMRAGVGVHNTTYRGKIYYRITREKMTDSEKRDWDCWDNDDQNTQYKNNLFILTGPCYTASNL